MSRATCLILAAALAGAAGGCASEPVMFVNCGSAEDFVDADGRLWLADREKTPDADWGAVGGKTVKRTGLEIPDCPLAPLYLTERYGMTAYEFALADGLYMLRLHFAETYEKHSQAGQRVFSVKVNGREALADLDVLKEAGGFARPLVRKVDFVRVEGGRLRIEFVPGVQNPEINAIEIHQY